jgi:hypothetical protein
MMTPGGVKMSEKSFVESIAEWVGEVFDRTFFLSLILIFVVGMIVAFALPYMSHPT